MPAPDHPAAGGPGQVDPNPATIDGSYLLTSHIPFGAALDSMSIDQEGNLYVASILPTGWDPNSCGGITVISPHGDVLEWIELKVGQPDPLPSNICFGGSDRRTAFITMGGTGRVISCEMRVPGKVPAFE